MCRPVLCAYSNCIELGCGLKVAISALASGCAKAVRLPLATGKIPSSRGQQVVMYLVEEMLVHVI